MGYDLPFGATVRALSGPLLLLASACSGGAREQAPPAQPPLTMAIPPSPSTSASVPVATTTAKPSQFVRFERWRPVVDINSLRVQIENTVPLGAARRVPFAAYLNAMHNRIHPIFAEQFLEMLSGLPKEDPLNSNLSTALEIVIEKDTGKIVRMVVSKTSGVTGFDLAALSSVERAAPFGPAPEVIASPDGNVYIHWEFHRDPFDACTTRNVRPFILKGAP